MRCRLQGAQPLARVHRSEAAKPMEQDPAKASSQEKTRRTDRRQRTVRTQKRTANKRHLRLSRAASKTEQARAQALPNFTCSLFAAKPFEVLLKTRETGLENAPELRNAFATTLSAVHGDSFWGQECLLLHREGVPGNTAQGL